MCVFLSWICVYLNVCMIYKINTISFLTIHRLGPVSTYTSALRSARGCTSMCVRAPGRVSRGGGLKYWRLENVVGPKYPGLLTPSEFLSCIVGQARNSLPWKNIKQLKSWIKILQANQEKLLMRKVLLNQEIMNYNHIFHTENRLTMWLVI